MSVLLEELTIHVVNVIVSTSTENTMEQLDLSMYLIILFVK